MTFTVLFKRFLWMGYSYSHTKEHPSIKLAVFSAIEILIMFYERVLWSDVTVHYSVCSLF
jgi:hypothetical protein